MKITKSQLKRIIQEELKSALNEAEDEMDFVSDLDRQQTLAGSQPDEQHQEVNLDDDLVERAIWYYKNPRGLSDLKIIAAGRPMPDVVDIDRSEAEKIVLIARALELANAPK